VTGLTVLNEREEVAVAGVDLHVHEGEIVGIAGVQGNGQTELVEALTGLRPPSAGHVSYLGGDITKAPHANATSAASPISRRTGAAWA
jgi:general nucleoside transport system ATP-binding protein